LRARIEDILIEGNESVGSNIVKRELPLEPGDYFSRKRLSQGQSDLFGMNLFRFAIAELPEQPRDSSVVIRYRLGESNKRSLTLAGGYSGEFGLSSDFNLIHRNFLGGARSATFSGIVETGWGANPGNGKTTRRSAKVSLSLRQPYIFTRGLSLTLAPFYNRLDDPNQNTDLYSVGITSTVLYRILAYRTATIEYNYNRNVPLSGRGTNEPFDLYDVNSYALGLTFGKLNDYLNPTRGYMLSPRYEAAGTIFDSGVSYRKGLISGRVFIPVTKRSSFAAMLTYGLMVPFGNSSDQSDPETEYRFDGVRFYAGGSNDVRK
jgi:outer membrane protein insertion porin family